MLGYTQEMLVTANEAKIEARDAGTTTTRRRQLTSEFSYSQSGWRKCGSSRRHLLEPRFWIASGLPLQELSPGGSKKRPVT